MSITICLYFPGDPKALFQFLDSVVKYRAWKTDQELSQNLVEILLWVDNNDHKTSSEFDTLRRYIKNGLNFKVFINPPLESSDAVFQQLKRNALGSKIFSHVEFENYMLKQQNSEIKTHE